VIGAFGYFSTELPLRIPEESLAMSPQRLQLAVVVGQHVSPRIVGAPGATSTITQPASRLLSQNWRLAQNQIVSVPFGRARAGALRP
jgi:hypothetical protein